MNSRVDQINKIVGDIEFIEIIEPFQEAANKSFIAGKVVAEENGVKLPFVVIISTHYPFRLHDVETIRFINTDLTEYDHVMGDGSICVHTLHSPELKNKLFYDFSSLKQWINKYYINNIGDNNYEHIIVPQSPFKGINYNFLFTDVNHQFEKDDFGFFKHSILSIGNYKGIPENTFIVQGFRSDEKIIYSNWSENYLSLPGINGIYVYVESPPVEKKRFAVRSWSDLIPYLNEHFISFLYETQKSLLQKGSLIPIIIFVGYKIPSGEIHWQAVMFDSIVIPNYIENVDDVKSFEQYLSKTEIHWLQTKNCSYGYFFGRGTLDAKLTNRKILIIGIGAIGSMVATTLVRGGATNITLVDYDKKEPENVCRAEYFFNTGVNSKTLDLQETLIQISPFVKVEISEILTDAIKHFINKEEHNDQIKTKMEEYDLIFDCTTDNDFAFILESLNLKIEIINLSITNHARELVCVTNPDVYKWVNHIFNTLDGDEEDLYNPTGCWSPTFKASYNDIAVMVQYAIKQINNTFTTGNALRNFYLQVENDNGINIKLHQF